VFPEDVKVSSQLGYGGFLQAQSYDLAYGRYAAGFQFGNALGGELGWAYRERGATTDWSHGIHAAVFFSAGIPVLSLRSTIPLRSGGNPAFVQPGFELGLCLAIKLPIPFGDLDFIGPLPHGRPLRVGDHVLLPELRAGGRPIASESLPNASARRWAEDARAEAASVPAFLRLAEELAREGARGLAERALGAARDEVRHTRACLALASHYAGAPLEVTPVPLLPPRAPTLETLAVESLVDGFVGEGRAAADARAALAGERDPLARRALALIAVDEQRHADLGRDVARFAMARGGAPVRLACRACGPAARLLEAEPG
jgi:hypothetical protein